MATSEDTGIATAHATDRRLFSSLEGRQCPACEDGTLERATYKGNRAICCEQCGVPRIQVWR